MLRSLGVELRTIALVTDWCPPRIGGVERHVSGLAAALAARGHDVHLFTTTPNAVAPPGIAVHVVRTPMLGEVARPGVGVVRTLRARFREIGADVVHAHGMFSTLAIAGLIAAHRERMASVTTHHSLLRRSPTQPLAWLIYRLFSNRATLVTAVSEAAALDAHRASGRDEVLVLPNGFDRAEWTRPRRPDSGVVRIACVMRLARKKSARDLIDAVPVVLSNANERVLFTIVGDGPERRALEQRAHRRGVSAHVEFLGACDRERIAAVLACSSVFALPTRREAFSLAILEARAAGLPIVARASGGVPEVVTHGRHGLLAASRTDFARALVRLVNDAALREQLARQSASGLEAFRWDRVVERHEDVYKAAIDAHVTARGESFDPLVLSETGARLSRR